MDTFVRCQSTVSTPGAHNDRRTCGDLWIGKVRGYLWNVMGRSAQSTCRTIRPQGQRSSWLSVNRDSNNNNGKKGQEASHGLEEDYAACIGHATENQRMLITSFHAPRLVKMPHNSPTINPPA